VTEPKPWGKYGPETECLAWVTWGRADPGWEHLVWSDDHGDYYMTGEALEDIDCLITHWLPMPPAPEAEPCG